MGNELGIIEKIKSKKEYEISKCLFELLSESVLFRTVFLLLQ